MKEKCCYCEVVLDSIQCKTSKTEDGYTCCIDCYHKIFNDLFKGTFTYEEGLNTLHNRLKYNELISEYLVIVKKLGKANNEDVDTILEKIISLERCICKLQYHAERQPIVMDINKHYKVVKIILGNNMLNTIFKITDIRGIHISPDDYDTRLMNQEYLNIDKPRAL